MQSSQRHKRQSGWICLTWRTRPPTGRSTSTTDPLTQMPGQPGAVGAGPSTPTRTTHRTPAATQLGPHSPPRSPGLAVTDLPPQMVNHRGVIGLAMRIDATNDNPAHRSCWTSLHLILLTPDGSARCDRAQRTRQ